MLQLASVELGVCVCVRAGSVTSGVGPAAYITTHFCTSMNPTPLGIPRGTAPLYCSDPQTPTVVLQTAGWGHAT